MEKKRIWLEKGMEGLFFSCAMIAVLATLVICYFIFANGLPFIVKQDLNNFLFGREWGPSNTPATYGILPMIYGSVMITLGAMVIGVPIGILTATYMAYFCPKVWHKSLQAAIHLMASIPSIVYGFFGLQVLVPLMKNLVGGTGMNSLTASFLLGIMILPTIVSLSSAAIHAVPKSYYQGSMGLGASHEQSVFHVILPAAKSGIISSVILGLGRAIGETMAVILVAGNQARIPSSLTQGVRTLTTNIVMEMAYAAGDHRQALIATSAVLFAFILLINASFAWMKRKG